MLFWEWRSERSEGVKTNAIWGVRRQIFHFYLKVISCSLPLAPCPLHPPFGRAGVGIPWEGWGGYHCLQRAGSLRHSSSSVTSSAAM